MFPEDHFTAHNRLFFVSSERNNLLFGYYRIPWALGRNNESETDDPVLFANNKRNMENGSTVQRLRLEFDHSDKFFDFVQGLL